MLFFVFCDSACLRLSSFNNVCSVRLRYSAECRMKRKYFDAVSELDRLKVLLLLIDCGDRSVQRDFPGSRGMLQEDPRTKAFKNNSNYHGHGWTTQTTFIFFGVFLVATLFRFLVLVLGCFWPLLPLVSEAGLLSWFPVPLWLSQVCLPSWFLFWAALGYVSQPCLPSWFSFGPFLAILSPKHVSTVGSSCLLLPSKLVSSFGLLLATGLCTFMCCCWVGVT